MELSNQQISQFKENGFLLIKAFASKDLCNNILQKAKLHLEKKILPLEYENDYLEAKDKNTTIRRLRQVYNREDIFKEWMTSNKIRPILKQLLDDVAVLSLAHHNSIMTKMPKESSITPWHQDRRYWNYENDNLISIWLALDDEYLDNGLLQFIPKSHKIDFIKEQFDKNSNFLDEHILNYELLKTKVSFNLHKGDIVLFHSRTLHKANKNNTLNPKISFVYTVKAQSNKAIKGTRSDFKEVVLS